MDRIHHVRLMAAYNAAMNASMYAAARRLPAAELEADRKAFFGSLLGTLNHLANADLIWLKRFAGHAARFPLLEAVRAVRYVNSRGAADKNLFSLLMHFFNHQTHHRGQASTLLSQQGIDIGVTDLLALIPEQS